MSLVQEFKRRHLFRVGIAYCGSGWLVLQLAHLVVVKLNFPQWIMPSLIAIGVLGFPAVLYLAWTYEYTLEGLKRREQVQAGESLTQETRSTLNKLITAFLLLALLLVLAEGFFPLLS